MDIDLTGKTALITGASLGLGRAMAAAFHGAGANVALLARREDVLAEAEGGDRVAGWRSRGARMRATLRIRP